MKLKNTRSPRPIVSDSGHDSMFVYAMNTSQTMDAPKGSKKQSVVNNPRHAKASTAG